MVLLALLTLLGASGSPQGDARPSSPLPAPVDPVAEVPGERLPPGAFGPGVVEDMQAMLARAGARRVRTEQVARKRNGAHGEWSVPKRGDALRPHSGTRYVINRWGDRRMAIGFPAPVDVEGVWIAGQASPGAWAPAVRVVGFRGGREVARTDEFTDVDETPSWFPIALRAVDRIEFHARAAVEGAAWYALDDLTFVRGTDAGPETVVLDFEDLPFRTSLTDSGYAGLEWERGGGEFTPDVTAVHPPVAPRTGDEPGDEPGDDPHATPEGGAGTAPGLVRSFFGVRMFEPGTGFIPPDTCGVAGPDHFVSIVNGKLTAFDKVTGARTVDIPLVDFWAADELGDPRIVFDHHSQRYFALCSSGPWTQRIYVAISLTSDPGGSWFKSFIQTDQGDDAGRWPDYPTLGFDAHGFYSGALMVGNGDPMTLWAIDKAPLLAMPPSLGTVTAWRGFQFQGALQPSATFGDPAGEHVISRGANGNQLRIRRIDGPLDAPTLVDLGGVAIPSHGSAPGAPALGSAADISTGDWRPINAVYRDGSIWTAHTINVAARAACRWYEVDPDAPALLQMGTVSDPVWHYFYPSLSVNALGDVAMGFSGCHAGEYVGCFYTGRRRSDPAGQMAPPELLRAGGGAYQHLDGNGTNRWGDYSLTSVDPVDDESFWTIQEYARLSNRWGTYVGLLAFEGCASLASNYCVSTANSEYPGAVMQSSGSHSIASNELVLEAVDVPALKPGLFYYGGAAIQVPFGDGFRCVGSGGAGVYRLHPVVQSDPFGYAENPIDLALHPWIAPDSTWHFQLWFRDPAGPGGTGFNLSDGLSVTFCK